VKQKEAQ
jgi:dynein heavy chain 2